MVCFVGADRVWEAAVVVEDEGWVESRVRDCRQHGAGYGIRDLLHREWLGGDELLD